MTGELATVRRTMPVAAAQPESPTHPQAVDYAATADVILDSELQAWLRHQPTPLQRADALLGGLEAVNLAVGAGELYPPAPPDLRAAIDSLRIELQAAKPLPRDTASLHEYVLGLQEQILETKLSGQELEARRRDEDADGLGSRMRCTRCRRRMAPRQAHGPDPSDDGGRGSQCRSCAAKEA